MASAWGRVIGAGAGTKTVSGLTSADVRLILAAVLEIVRGFSEYSFSSCRHRNRVARVHDQDVASQTRRWPRPGSRAREPFIFCERAGV